MKYCYGDIIEMTLKGRTDEKVTVLVYDAAEKASYYKFIIRHENGSMEYGGENEKTFEKDSRWIGRVDLSPFFGDEFRENLVKHLSSLKKERNEMNDHIDELTKYLYDR